MPENFERDSRTLQRRNRLTVAQSLLFRALLVLGLFSIALFGHWMDRDGLRDNVDGKVSFADVMYFTTITVTTVGYGDIVPVTPRARMFDTFVVTPIRIFVWLIFLGTAYTVVFQKVMKRSRSKMIAESLRNHVVIAGWGASGEAAVRDLLLHGHDPSQIVVIDPSPDRLQIAMDLGTTTLRGDSTHNSVLTLAGIQTARAVLVSVHRDDTAALIVLSARQLNPLIQISASVRAYENEDLLRQAGANAVINPVSIGGHLLSLSSGHTHAADYVQDLVSAEGQVVIHERLATEADAGQPLSRLGTGVGVRLIRNGRIIGTWDSDATAVREGDTIIEIIKLTP